MNSVIYAISGDPITYGHIDIIDRALKTFTHVLVGIGINPKKRYTFDLEERTSLIKKVLAPYGERVSVKSYSGLLSDFAYENGIHQVIRGARNAADFDYERLLADINHGLSVGLETFIMVADQKLSHISSSAVKELQEHQAKNIAQYVPLAIKEALEIKISGQYRIGITGGIGCGKSFVEDYLKDYNKNYIQNVNENHVKINAIDMDKIGRYILKESNESIHLKIRKDIADSLGVTLMDNFMIDIKELLKIIFDEPRAKVNRNKFEAIMEEPTMHIVRRQLKELKGVVLISSALFVESCICDLVNNNFIFVSCPEDVRIGRLEKRGYTHQEIQNRLAAQFTPEDKLKHINGLIKENCCGSIIEFNNLDNDEKGLKNLYDQVVAKWSSMI